MLQFLEIPGRVTRAHGAELHPFRLDITANIDPALYVLQRKNALFNAFQKKKHVFSQVVSLLGYKITKKMMPSLARATSVI